MPCSSLTNLVTDPLKQPKHVDIFAYVAEEEEVHSDQGDGSAVLRHNELPQEDLAAQCMQDQCNYVNMFHSRPKHVIRKQFKENVLNHLIGGL